MSRALHDGEFMRYYQPEVCRDFGRCSGAEALLRWPRRDSLSVPPIIEIAERNGLITKIDEWMIRGVCRQLEHWGRVGTEEDDRWVEMGSATADLTATLSRENLAPLLVADEEEGRERTLRFLGRARHGSGDVADGGRYERGR